LSIIADVPFLLDAFKAIFGMEPHYEAVNVVPGEIIIANNITGKMQQVVKALRLIRLIRIIKLYKYIKQSTSKEGPDEEEFEDEEEEEEMDKNEKRFKRETDPTKLGKALSD